MNINNLPNKEIEDFNDLLLKTIGNGWVKFNYLGLEILFEGENFIGEIVNSKNNLLVIKPYAKEKILGLLKRLDKDTYLTLYRIINFYYPRLIAFHVIKESDDEYAEFSSSNELLIALTSIIDLLANERKERGGYTKRFIRFLKKHLSKHELNNLFKYGSVVDGEERKLESLNDFAEYIYRIRSMVVHNAELGGIYPYGVNFDTDIKTGYPKNVSYMLIPEVFRRLLWKAILKSLGLNIIY